MSPITLTSGAFILLALFCGFISALAAAAVTQSLASRYVREAIFEAVADANCILVRDISCETVIKASDGRVIGEQQITTAGVKVSSQFVEKWLESRDLVMAPKGKDFKVKVTS